MRESAAASSTSPPRRALDGEHHLFRRHRLAVFLRLDADRLLTYAR
jgi:hypothetical protein